MFRGWLYLLFYSAQVKVFVEGLFFLNKNITAFKEHLRDFLVEIKVMYVLVLLCVDDVHGVTLQEFTGEDTHDLYLEERESQLRKEQEKKHEQQLQVPGILNPHERPDEMQE